MFFDPLYLVIIVPAMILAGWAQWKVHSAYARARQIPVRSGITGARAAQHILESMGVHDVGIEVSRGMLTDHYDPRHRMLRLSPEVYNGRSIASVGVAAHEAGHAIQQATGYAPLAIRNGIVPLAQIGPGFAMLIFIMGMAFQMFGLVLAGLVIFGSVAFFQLVNLPVEFNASNRARQLLVTTGVVTATEEPEVARVLNAAALTYVAATLMSILTFMYYLYRSGLLGGRRN